MGIKMLIVRYCAPNNNFYGWSGSEYLECSDPPLPCSVNALIKDIVNETRRIKATRRRPDGVEEYLVDFTSRNKGIESSRHFYDAFALRSAVQKALVRSCIDKKVEVGIGSPSQIRLRVKGVSVAHKTHFKLTDVSICHVNRNEFVAGHEAYKIPERLFRFRKLQFAELAVVPPVSLHT